MRWREGGGGVDGYSSRGQRGRRYRRESGLRGWRCHGECKISLLLLTLLSGRCGGLGRSVVALASITQGSTFCFVALSGSAWGVVRNERFILASGKHDPVL